MELAHAGEETLAGILVLVPGQGLVFAAEQVQHLVQAFLVLAVLGLDGDGDHRVGEGDALEGDAAARFAEGIADAAVAQAHQADDIAGADLLDHLGGLGVDAQELLGTDALSGAAVQQRVAGA